MKIEEGTNVEEIIAFARASESPINALREVFDQVEKRMIEDLLKKHTTTESARLLGLSRTTLWRHMKNLDIPVGESAVPKAVMGREG